MAEQEKDVNSMEETVSKKIDAENPEVKEDASLGEEQDTLEEGSIEAAEDKDNTADKKAEKKMFKKKDKSKEKIEELEDRVKRQMAEFENFRRRTEKEKSTMFEAGAKNVIEKILPVVDNFERGLQSVPEEEKDGSFADGMRMIYKQLMTELSNLGVTEIESVGAEFDPELHNAVMQVASEEYETGLIAQELLKGYKYRETVIRHSMVAVVE